MIADLLGQPQQPHVVGDRRPILADRFGDLFLGQAELVAEAAIGVRFFDRIQILALDVLDERRGQQLVVGNVADDDRHLEEAGALRRAPAALAGDDLVAVLRLAHDDRLDHAVRPDRAGQLVDPPVVHVRARLELVRPQQVDVDFERSFVDGGQRGHRE